jgi:AraC family transcriptional regulator of adaptative response / DNA-3-methyladenine glycosylase II
METMEHDKLYRAMISRDPRNDGRFYYGVTTTRVYCRPICAARPRQENVLFFRSKAEAEKAGYRPCLRCCPDLAPTSRQWQGTASVVGRAMGMIERGDLDGNRLADVAARLGMTDRHLRRLFSEHVGASPMDVAISRRLHVARQLLSQTGLSIVDIALAAGFGSLRRFNDAFLTTYNRSPREYRRETLAAQAAEDSIRLRIPYVGRFDWDFLTGYFRNHEVFGVEAVEGNSYLRHFRTTRGESCLRVEHLEEQACLQLSIRINDFLELRPLVESAKQVFDTDHNPHQIAVPEGCPEHLRAFMGANGGIRVPGAFDPFETAVAIILGQLVSVGQGRANLRKLVERFGDRSTVPFHPGLTHFFPSAATLAREDLTSLGITRVRAKAVRELAAACLDGKVELSRSCDLERTRAALLSIGGIGPWTVEMIALRCLGDPDAFPAGDLIIKRTLEQHPILRDEFAPWQAYLALAIWKNHISTLPKAGEGAVS